MSFVWVDESSVNFIHNARKTTNSVGALADKLLMMQINVNNESEKALGKLSQQLHYLIESLCVNHCIFRATYTF